MGLNHQLSFILIYNRWMSPSSVVRASDALIVYIAILVLCRYFESYVSYWPSPLYWLSPLVNVGFLDKASYTLFLRFEFHAVRDINAGNKAKIIYTVSLIF